MVTQARYKMQMDHDAELLPMACNEQKLSLSDIQIYERMKDIDKQVRRNDLMLYASPMETYWLIGTIIVIGILIAIGCAIANGIL